MNTTQLIHMVSVEEIKAASFNPKNRTERAALEKLLEDIRAVGFIMSPLLVSSIDSVLGDGHRRLACAKLLGLSVVPVRYLPMPAAEIYALANNSAKPQGGRGWAAAAALGYPIDQLPVQHRRLIEDWIEALGPEDFTEMARRRSTDIVSVARAVRRFVRQSSPEALRTVLLWLDKHNMTRAVIDAKRDGISPKAVEDAINEDRPLQKFWG